MQRDLPPAGRVTTATNSFISHTPRCSQSSLARRATDSVAGCKYRETPLTENEAIMFEEELRRRQERFLKSTVEWRRIGENQGGSRDYFFALNRTTGSAYKWFYQGPD